MRIYAVSGETCLNPPTQVFATGGFRGEGNVCFVGLAREMGFCLFGNFGGEEFRWKGDRSWVGFWVGLGAEVGYGWDGSWMAIMDGTGQGSEDYLWGCVLRRRDRF